MTWETLDRTDKIFGGMIISLGTFIVTGA